MKQNCYVILGVSRKATHDEIRKAAQSKLDEIKKSFHEGNGLALGVAADAKREILLQAANARGAEIKKAY